MTAVFAGLWRRLNAATIGTEAYWWIALQNAAFYQDMRPLVLRHVNGRTLDLGAGRLAWTDLVKTLTTTYIAGDISMQAKGLDVVFDTTKSLPFSHEAFQTVFCCSVLEHVPDPEIALREIARILAPSGIAIVSVPFCLQLHDEPYDYYRFTSYGIELLTTRAGFEIQETVVNGGLFHLVLNVPSIATSVILYRLGLLFAVKLATRCWLTLARGLDSLFGLSRVYASNHIVVLRKLNTT